MAECYPTGCPPCTEEISFPENPTNGQRECFFIGKDPNTNEDILKCWVYDQCIPGWRAEGPAVAPLQFKGGVDLTKTEKENNIGAKEAGDYYIVNNGSADILDSNGNVIKTAQQFLNDEWASLQHPILEGAFILWSGTEWIEIPRPCGEPCVQADWLETEKDECSFIKNKPEIPDAVGNIGDGGTLKIVIDELAPVFCSGGNLILNADVVAEDSDSNQVLGLYTYTWQSSNNGTDWVNLAVIRDNSSTARTQSSYTLESYTGNPAQVRVQVEFMDLYGNTITAVSDPIIPVAGSTASITAQPSSVDLSTNTTDQFTVTDNVTGTKTYRWFVNQTLVTGANTPDLGYTFSNWETGTLGVTRDDAAAGSYPVRVEIENESNCNPLLVSDTVQLIGPTADGTVPAPPVTEFGAIGSYTLTNSGGTSSTAQRFGVGTIYPSSQSGVPGQSGQQWRCMGYVFAVTQGDGITRPPTERAVILWVRVS